MRCARCLATKLVGDDDEPLPPAASNSRNQVADSGAPKQKTQQNKRAVGGSLLLQCVYASRYRARQTDMEAVSDRWIRMDSIANC